ncbi:MAG: hypothetical protein HY036_08300 [Nitrospirae bacterium]|nr:hypothetical protein [Nitrospirota bacterium]MBI3352566.1 hypothetical protein [Nitrospirota bacterium]
MKKGLSGMLLLAGLFAFILGGCYEKQSEAPKATAPEAVTPAPTESSPTSAPAASAPTSAPTAAK